MMKDNSVYADYYKIVKKENAEEYKGPENQGRAIKRCTILKPVTISYSDRIVLTKHKNKTLGFNTSHMVGGLLPRAD